MSKDVFGEDAFHGEAAFMHMPEHGLSMFLAERTKTLHFIRHAEGLHNAAIKEANDDNVTKYNFPGSEVYIDAPLTEKGIAQCRQVRARTVLDPQPEIIIVSPLTRTLQTAYEIFNGLGIKFLVHDLARERWGLYQCDRRRTYSEITKEFNEVYKSESIDFKSFGFQSESDVDWTEAREASDHVSERAIQLLQWLAKRPEKSFAIVTHSSFLRHLFSNFGCSLSTADRTILQRATGNAEIRSITLAAHCSI